MSSGPEERYAWHYKPEDMVRSKLELIVQLLQSMKKPEDMQQEKEFGFTLQKKQVEKINRWRKKHKCTSVDAQGERSSSITYCFHPTGIGTAEVARCSCGAELNVTDYDTW